MTPPKRKAKIPAPTQFERPHFTIEHECPGCGKPPEEFRDSAGMPIMPGIEPLPDEDSVFCSGCAAQLGRENGWRVIAVIHEPAKAKRGPKAQEVAEDASSE